MKFTVIHFVWLAWVLVAATGHGESFTWNPQADAARPGWFRGVESQQGELLTSTTFELGPAGSGDLALAVTLFFEDGVGLLRVIWQSAHGSLLLASNLSEGQPMLNRRTLLISASDAGQGGRLIIQSDDPGLRVCRVVFDWLNRTTSLTPAGSYEAYVRLPAREVDSVEAVGAPPPPIEDLTRAGVFAAVLQEAPVSLADDLAFQAEFGPQPQRLIWECEIGGLPAGHPVHLWVNGRWAGQLHLDLPDLWDPAWFHSATGPSRLAGWCRARLWIAPELVRPGPNVFQLAHGPGSPHAILTRRIRIQTTAPEIRSTPSLTAP